MFIINAFQRYSEFCDIFMVSRSNFLYLMVKTIFWAQYRGRRSDHSSGVKNHLFDQIIFDLGNNPSNLTPMLSDRLISLLAAAASLFRIGRRLSGR